MIRSTEGGESSPDLAVLTDEIVERIRQGEPVEIDHLVEHHPQHADALRELLPMMQLLADLSQPSGESAGDSEALLPREIGDFRILRELGRGGMGVVYEARQLSLNRRAALKVLPFAAMFEEKQLARFKNEAQAAASLDHENIVHAYAVGCDRGVHYFAMQYIEGQNLAEAIAELRQTRGGQPPANGPGEAESPPTTGTSAGLAPQEAEDAASGAERDIGERSTDCLGLSSTAGDWSSREYFKTIAHLIAKAAEALDYAHQRGVVHRDVKPSNLLLDTNQKIYVADFGLASIEGDRNLTSVGGVLGTARYMSPEQAAGDTRRVDHRTDIYSLGATLYELAALRPAYRGADQVALLRRIASEEPPALRKLNRRIPRDLETIVVKAMAKEPAERYATAAELAEDLRRFAEDEAIVARPPGIVQQAARWTRRHRTFVAVLAAVLTLLAVAGPVIAVNQAALAHEARQRANEATAALDRESDALKREKAATAIARQEQQAADAARIKERQQRKRAERQRDRAERLQYASDMLAARVAWDNGNLNGMVEILEDHRPNANGRDFRGWEWYYLLALTQSHTEMIPLSRASAYGALSPNGKLFAYNARNTVHVIDCAGNELHTFVHRLVRDHFSLEWNSDSTRVLVRASNQVLVFDLLTQETIVQDIATPGENVLAFSWKADGSQFAYARQPKEGDLAKSDARNVARNELIIRGIGDQADPLAVIPFSQRMLAIEWSPQGGRIAIVLPREVSIRLPDGKELTTLPLPWKRSLRGAAVAWSPDEQRMTLDAATRGLAVLRIDDQSAGLIDGAVPGPSRGLKWSPDGRYLIRKSSGHSEMWDVDGRRRFFGPRNARELILTRTFDSAFSPDGAHVAAIVGGSGGAKINIWEIATGRLKNVFRVVDDAHDIAWFPEGTKIAVVSFSKMYIFDDVTEGGSQEASTLHAPPFRTRFVWAPDSRRLATLAHPGSSRNPAEAFAIHVFDSETGRVLRRIPTVERDFIVESWPNAIAWSSDGKHFALGSRAVSQPNVEAKGNDIRVWDSDTWRLTHSFSVPSGVYELAFVGDRQLLAAATEAGSIQLWDLERSKEAYSLSRNRRGAIAAANGGRLFAMSNADASIWEWQIGAGEPSGPTCFANTWSGVHAISCDGSRIASAKDSNAVIWDTATGEGVQTLRSAMRISQAAWNPDGQRLAFAGNANIEIWDAESGRLLIRLDHSQGRPTQIGWSPDGNKLAMADDQGRITIRDASRGYGIPAPRWKRVVRHQVEVESRAIAPQKVVTLNDNEQGIDHAKSSALTSNPLQEEHTPADNSQDSRARALHLAARAFTLLRHEEWEDAESALRECQAVRENLAPEDWRTFRSKSMLGETLFRTGRLKEAEPLLLSACEGIVEAGAPKPIVRETLMRIVELYEVWDRPTEADRWRGILEGVKPADPPAPTAPTTEARGQAAEPGETPGEDEPDGAVQEKD